MAELYTPSVGGQEVFFQELGETMVRRGHSVDLYCIGHEPGLAATETINGVQVHRNPNGGRYKNPRIKALRRNWSDIAKFSAGVRRAARTQQYDFYLMNEWPLLHVPTMPKRSRSRCGIHWCEIREDRVLRTLQKRLPRMVGSNFAVSNAVGEAIAEQSGRQCLVLPSGIQLDRYRSADRAARAGVLYVGRLAPHKNLPLLVDAFELAADRGFAGDLVIAGNGPSRDEIGAYADRSRLAERINVLGPVEEAHKIELLSQAAVLGMPSMREGFPRVITEAMASGLPVVTPSFPENGAKDVVAQYNAGVVSGTDPAEFAEALLAVEAGWQAFSEAGLAAAKSLDWSGVAHTLEVRIREVTGRCAVNS